MSLTMTDEIYTLDEAAEKLKVHPITIRRAINRGELKAFHVGDKLRIRKVALDEYIRQQEEQKQK